MTSIKRTHDVQEHPKLPDVLTLEHRFPKRSTTNSSTSCRNSSISALDAPDAPDAPVCRDADVIPMSYTHVMPMFHQVWRERQGHALQSWGHRNRGCVISGMLCVWIHQFSNVVVKSNVRRTYFHLLLKLTSTKNRNAGAMCTSSYGHFISLVLRKKTKLRRCSEKFSLIVCPFP